MDRHKSVRMRPHIPEVWNRLCRWIWPKHFDYFLLLQSLFAMTREMSLHIYSLESKHYNDILIGSMVTVNNRKLKMKPLAG